MAHLKGANHEGKQSTHYSKSRFYTQDLLSKSSSNSLPSTLQKNIKIESVKRT